MAYDPNVIKANAPLGIAPAAPMGRGAFARPMFNRNAAKLGADVGLGMRPNRNPNGGDIAGVGAGDMRKPAFVALPGTATAADNGGVDPRAQFQNLAGNARPITMPGGMFPGAGGPPSNNDGMPQVDPNTNLGAAGVANDVLPSDQPGGTSVFGGGRSAISPLSGMSEVDRRRRLLMAGGAAGAAGGFGGVGPRMDNVGLDNFVDASSTMRSQLRPTSPIRDTLRGRFTHPPIGPAPLDPTPSIQPGPDLIDRGVPSAPINTLQPPKPTAPIDPASQPSPTETAPVNNGNIVDYNPPVQPFKNGGRARASVGLMPLGKFHGAASGKGGSVMALANGGAANDWEQFHYDPTQPIESQIKTFLNGRNPYGEMKDPNWFKDPSLYQQYVNPDESGTQNYGYRAVDPRLADIQPGAVGPEWNSRIIDNQYTPVGWSASSHADAVNGLKPDSMYDYGKMVYNPRYGLAMNGDNVRDPDARHDAWYGAGMMTAVAGPALLAAAGLGAAGAGAGAGTGELGAVAATDAAESGGTLALNAAGNGVSPYVGTGLGESVGLGSELPTDLGSTSGVDPGVEANTGLTEPPSSPMGGDAPAGTEMPNQYSPGTDPQDPHLYDQIDPVQLEKSPQIQEMAQRQGMSVQDWLKDPRNLQTAARAVGSLVSLGAGGGGTGAGNTALVPEPGPEAIGQSPGTPGASNADVRGTLVDPNSITSKLFDTIPQASGGSGNWSAARGQVQPLQDMLFAEATKAGSPAEQEAAAARAGADAKQAFETNRQKRRADLIAQGINPDDARGAGAEMDRLSTLDEAKATTSGKNLARLAEKNKGFTERAQAIGLGNTTAAQGLQADNIAATTSLGNARIASDVGLGSARISADLANANAGRTNQQVLQGQQLGYQDRWKQGDQAIDRARVNAGITATNTNQRRQSAIDTGAGASTLLNGAGSVYNFGSAAGWWNEGGRIDVGLGTAAKVTRGYRGGGRVKAKVKMKSYDAGGAVDDPAASNAGGNPRPRDTVRAMLTDGEHVLNPEAVELMDETQPGALDHLNEQGLKIRAVREALRKHMSNVGLGA